MLGRFWAISVGPGDPDLLTVKAVRILERARVIYHAGPERYEGRALEIVRTYLRTEQEIRVVLTEPMNAVAASDWKTHYGPGVAHIAADCRRGRDVAYITEGDATLYSTAACVRQLLSELDPEIAIEIVPGVSSITAAAARLGWALAQKDESLAVAPANYCRHDIGHLLDQFHTVCLLKPSSVMPDIVHALEEYGPRRQFAYVENLGNPGEFITQEVAALAERKNYFSLLIVRRPAETEALAGTQTPRAKAGKVSVIGLGPGDPHLFTQEACTALRQAEVIIGYDGYLRFLAPLSLRAELRGSAIGAETERAVRALESARLGRRVALVSSGDAGIYGMASVLLDRTEQMLEVDIQVIPGVTAATAAAALLGAPLGHDFACISLSDLLTPWDTIAGRLAAAGAADFVIALYNPVSQQRTWQLPRTRDILLQCRGPDTPVGLVDKAYRPGQRVWLTTLGELNPDGIGMETLLIVGNSQTRIVHGRMVTPRTRAYRPTEKLRQACGLPHRGRQIVEESFAIIDGEIGPHAFPPWAYAAVRRMIHASADFEFAQTLRYHADFETAFQAACRSRLPIVADTEMVLTGIRSGAARWGKITLACHLNDPETLKLADSADLTRSAAGIRLGARRYPTPILAIGNAPTALLEALRLIEEESWRPAAIVGMPVGFVGVVEAKDRLLRQVHVPYLTCVGRKGGSAVTAAAINALLEFSGVSQNRGSANRR